MSNERFFDETTEQSFVKSTIVSKYFWAWAQVIISSVKKRGGKLAYLDLFAGPGRYEDGAASTPITILQRAITDPDMREMLVTVFNDRDENHSRSLESAIRALPAIGTLKHAPIVLNAEVGSEFVKRFDAMKLIPTLFFVDPWGYKGLSLQLVNSVLKDWGCDCIFFFNYNRIAMGLSNPLVETHMNDLFGKDRADQLRQLLNGLSPADRESRIIEELCEALGAKDGRYVLPFRFRSDRGTRISHHLIFVSKAFKGYEIMKSIMANESSAHDQGVPRFEYNPVDARYPLLFELTRPLDELEGMLLTEFEGRQITMKQVYMQHNVRRPFIEKNYKNALKSLEAKNLITCEPAREKRRKDTMGPQTIIQFRRKT